MQTLTPQEVKNIWSQVKKELEPQLSPAAFSTWVLTNPLTEVQINSTQEAVGVISTPSAFHATNLKKNLYLQLKSALEHALNKKVTLDFKIQDPSQILSQQKEMSFKSNRQGYRVNRNLRKSSFQDQPSQSQNLNQNSQLTTNGLRVIESQDLESVRVEDLFSQQNIANTQQDRITTAIRRAGLRPDYTFKNFAVSGSNEMAHAAATAVAKRPGEAYNPLFLYGGVGVGKTHLMHAIGHHAIKQDPSKNVIYCTGEDFTNEIIDAIRSKKAIKFKKKFRSAQVLLIDDIQFIAGKNAVQEEFFHTFDALTKLSHQIILTSDRPPDAITLLEDRLKSRFEAGLMIDIQQPSLELRIAIVLIKSRSVGISLPMEIATKIATSVDSARKIEGVISIIRSEVELNGKEINDELIDNILQKEKTNGRPRTIRLKPQKVIKKICDHFDVKQSEVRGRGRNKELVYPRHIAMYFLKDSLNLSYVEIGKWFSNRDHTSVMHAKNKIEKMLEEDEIMMQDFSELKSKLLKLSD